MTTERILTHTDLSGLSIVANLAERNAKVGRALDNGDVIYGIARSIGDENGNFDFKSDVRDQYLRVTSRSGFDHFWPVAVLVAEVGVGLFGEVDW